MEMSFLREWCIELTLGSIQGALKCWNFDYEGGRALDRGEMWHLK